MIAYVTIDSWYPFDQVFGKCRGFPFGFVIVHISLYSSEHELVPQNSIATSCLPWRKEQLLLCMADQ